MENNLKKNIYIYIIGPVCYAHEQNTMYQPDFSYKKTALVPAPRPNNSHSNPQYSLKKKTHNHSSDGLGVQLRCSPLWRQLKLND